MSIAHPNFNVGSVSESTQLKSAASMADRGWPVFPLHFPVGNSECSCSNPLCSRPAKHPLTRHGYKNASTDLAVIREWWQRMPRANFGVMTGQTSGFVVLDVDPRHDGDKTLQKLQQEFGPLPATLKVKTGGNGEHYYFKHPGVKVTNRVNMRPGLDFRGDGGYIIAPPSMHVSGQAYTWLNPEQEIAPMPEWLLKIVLSPKGRTPEVKAKQTGEEHVKIDSQFLTTGNRNDSIYSLGGYLKYRGLDGDRLLGSLLALNSNACKPPLETGVIQDMAKRIDNYEEKPWSTVEDIAGPPVAPNISPEMLPPVLRRWCQDIAERMQVSLEFVAGPAIVMISSLIGRRLAVYPRRYDDWIVIVNLWGAIIGRPGSSKSPVLSSILKPLVALTIKARNRYLEEAKKREKELIILRTEVEALKDALKSALKAGKSDKITQCKNDLDRALDVLEKKSSHKEKRYMTNDPTIEKLLTILEANSQGMLLFRDELTGWIESMQKAGRDGDREFFLETWNGDNSYSMDRIGRGSTVVDGVCLSILGGLQPGKFTSYAASVAKDGKANDGLLQRFQVLIYPERRKEWKKVDRRPDQDAAKTVEDLLERIDQLPLPTRHGDKVERTALSFSDEAQEIADEWFEQLENRFCSENMPSMFEAHLSKYRSLMPSLAAIFEICESLGSNQGFPTSIGPEAIKMAIAWCNVLEVHARKAYGEHLDPEEAAGRRLLQKLKEGAIKDFDKRRDVYRRGWAGLTNPEAFEGALKALRKKGWIRIEIHTPPSGGRSEVIRIHPSLRSLAYSA